MIKEINFVSKFRKANIFSIIIFILSVIFITFKGLNYGIDFKGGTLIELRTEKSMQASLIRESLNSMNLGDVNVKRFGKDGDYLIKVEQKNTNNNLIPDFKFFIIASVEARAKRRLDDLIKVGDKNPGDFEIVLEELIIRDYKDSTRDHSPLKKADDALEIDTTHLTINEVVDKIVNTVNQKRTLY